MGLKLGLGLGLPAAETKAEHRSLRRRQAAAHRRRRVCSSAAAGRGAGQWAVGPLPGGVGLGLLLGVALEELTDLV